MNEPIAIIGMGCRFPGGANNPRQFWELLKHGVDAISETPPDRFNIDEYYDATPQSRGKVASREGGFLDQVDLFDAEFFGISPREANYTDPQQRLLLEVAWEALEDAGVVPSALAGSHTGVFVGMWTSDYEDRVYAGTDDINLYITTGGGRYSASGRLSYTFDLRGPSMTVDTACSSSLVTVLLACQSLWSGESTLALAGGVNLILTPQITVGYSRSGMLAPDGRCKFGDERANGYVRSEGVGLIALKRLSQAQADGDRIYALIRGGAVNNDGRSSELLVAPSPDTQADMLRDAYRAAGVDPAAVGYVEAHGTGTRVGDPVELTALGRVLGENRPADRPCALGSVKTNIGHAEAASGIAGLIKTALILQNRAIPASLHFETPNPSIPWAELPFVMQADYGAWPDSAEPAFAGVNSFGITGTNAHVVLEAYSEPTRQDSSTPATHVLPISAHSTEALTEIAVNLRAFIEGEPNLRDLAHTLGVHRGSHQQRAAVVGRSAADLWDKFHALATGDSIRGVVTNTVTPEVRKVAFVFPGQGGQWIGMGRQLLDEEPVFRAKIEEIEAILRPLVKWSLMEQLKADEAASRLEEIDVVQPMIFAVQVALAALWTSWGIVPDAVIGHSMGEVAAAHVAGALKLNDAVRVICRRSQLMKRVSGKGAMALVELPLEDAQAALKGYENRLSIAVSNSPRSSVISGDPAALKEVTTQLEAREVFVRPVKVDVAAHSPHMDALRPELVSDLTSAKLRAYDAPVPIYSTVIGDLLGGVAFNSEYWGRNLREPVLFGAAVARAIEDGINTFVEINAHPILIPAIERGYDGVQVIASLRREEDEPVTMREALGSLWALGYAVDWSKLSPAGDILTLPTYPFQRERCWAPEAELDSAKTGSRRAKFPHLSEPFRVPRSESVYFETEIDPSTIRDLREHMVGGQPVLPGSAYVEMALAAAEGASAITYLTFHNALYLTETRRVQIALTRKDGQTQLFECYTSAGDEWTLHASMTLRAGEAVPRNRPAMLNACFVALRDRIGESYVPVSAESVTFDHSTDDETFTVHLQSDVTRDGGNAVGSAYVIGDQTKRVIFTVDGLRVQRVKHDVSGWLHEIRWVEQKQMAEPQPLSGNWLVFADDGQIGAKVAARLIVAGAKPILVSWGGQFKEAQPGHYQIAADNPEGYDQLLALYPDLRGVVYTWAADAGADVDRGEILAGVVPLYLAQALVKMKETPRLWFITESAQAIDGEVASPAEALLWGLGAAIAEEHPELHLKRVDLGKTGREVEALVRELASESDEDQIALRGDQRLVARLIPYNPAPLTYVQVHAYGTYLITGGLGGLGLQLARWLAEQGAQNIVLLSRREPSAEAQAVIDDLSDEGVRVEAVQADVGDSHSLSAAIDQIRSTMPALHGVIHAAGVIENALLTQIDAAQFRRVLRPKVIGAWNLHMMTQPDQLDFFIMFGSIGVFGTAGGSSYGAANAFLDALAHYRHSMNFPALTIDWGVWEGVGMLADDELRAQNLPAGTNSFTAGEALSALERVWSATQVAVMPFDAQAYVASSPRQKPLLRSLLKTATAAVGASDAGLRQTLMDATLGKPRRFALEMFVREQVAAVLRLPPTRIDANKPLRSMGMDSLMTLELRKRLENGLSVSLSATLVFNYPTVATLTEHLAQKAGIPLDEDENPVVTDKAQEAASAVNDLSRDEIEAMLAEELDSLDDLLKGS